VLAELSCIGRVARSHCLDPQQPDARIRAREGRRDLGRQAGGSTFRPSDWAERLAGLTSAFGFERKLSYSPLVRSMSIAGVKAVVVGARLAALEPRLYQFLLNFARDNDLVVTQHADALANARSLEPPSIARREPREPV
jgi:hypothetical protein